MSLTAFEILIDNFKFSNDDALKFVTIAAQLGFTLDDFLHGKVYKNGRENNVEYTEIEQAEFLRDLIHLHKKIILDLENGLDKKAKEYIVSAGAPGVGKSSFLENRDQIVNPNRVYIDSDRRVMRFMLGYDEYVKKYGSERAYNFYRDASKFIANFLIVMAVYKGYSVVHGTTFTDERVPRILAGLKGAGYKTTVHVLFADRISRALALEHRVKSQKFFQITEQDAKGKVAPVFDRLLDAYLEYADKVTFAYNTNNYWLNEFPGFDMRSVRFFARAEREKDKMEIKWLPGNDDIFKLIMNDIKSEASSAKQNELLEKFEYAHEKDFDTKELVKSLEPKPYNFQQMFTRANITTGALTFIGGATTVAFAYKLVNGKAPDVGNKAPDIGSQAPNVCAPSWRL